MLSRTTFWSAVRKRPAWALLPIFESGLLNFIRDEPYLKLQYWALTGKELHLDPPITFNEKIAWLKINDHRKIYRTLADKFLARDFVAEHLDSTWLVPLLGVWKRTSDIDFSTLPDRFVLKCTHGYGGTVLCRDKDKLNISEAEAILQKTLRTDFYARSREWAYCNALPKIIAESLIDDGGGTRPADYKFMYFNGRVEFVCISRGLGDFSSGTVSFYYPDGRPAPFKRVDYPECPPCQRLPEQFERMKAAAETLASAADVPFVRIDFYESGGHAYFSEFTFYPCGGSIFFDPPIYDKILGDMLSLPPHRD